LNPYKLAEFQLNQSKNLQVTTILVECTKIEQQVKNNKEFFPQVCSRTGIFLRFGMWPSLQGGDLWCIKVWCHLDETLLSYIYARKL